MTDVINSKYPTLAKMGVESPKQIDKYYITDINQVEVLRIVYERPEGSFMPSSRSYKFPRQQVDKSKADSGALRTHPMLRDALEELKIIMAKKSTKEDIIGEILSEIELLEEDIAIRSECLKVLVAKVPEVECK